MEVGKLSTSQDGGLAGTQTGDKVLPHFTPPDLYGTRYDRLLFIAKINYNLSQAWYQNGCGPLAAEFFSVSDHYHTLANTCRPVGVLAGHFSSAVTR